MNYKFTQLKELPDSPLGTIYKGYIVHRERLDEEDSYRLWRTNERKGAYEAIVDKCVFDKSDFYKKEIDYDSLYELKCPFCEETRGTFIIHTFYENDLDRDNYGVNYEIAFECICGHIRTLTYKGDVGKKIDRIKKFNKLQRKKEGEEK